MENKNPTHHNSTEMSEDTRSIITILLLLMIPPVGIIVMWFLPKWKVWIKSLVTGCTCLPFIVLFLLFVLGIFSAVSGHNEIDNKKSSTSYNSVNIQGEKKVTTTTNNITNFIDVTGGYSVTYSKNELVSCDDNKYKKELTLWMAPYRCKGNGDVSYAVKISRDKSEDQYFPASSLVNEMDITLDGRPAVKYVYEFTEADGPLYGLGGVTIIIAESPTADYYGNPQVIRIEMLGNDPKEEVIYNKLLSSFRWTGQE